MHTHSSATTPPGVSFQDTPKPIAISFLLDRSGSMTTIKESTITGINSFVEQQKKNGVPTSISLTLFDSPGAGGVELLHVFTSIPIEEVHPLDDFSPRGNTPLYDAFWDTITWFEDQVRGKNVRVLFVVMTDGQENASRWHRSEELKARVHKKTEEGWEFVYLGANQDAYSEAQKMGVQHGNTMSYHGTPGGTRMVTQSVSAAAVAYAAAGASYKSGNFFGGSGGGISHPQSAPMSSKCEDNSAIKWGSNS